MLVLFLFVLMLINVKSDTECPVVPQNSIDRRVNKNTLRIVQYNTEWLFIDYYSPMDCPGDGCTWHSNSDAKQHMSYISSVIKELNPDIINICEIEGCDELLMLVNETSSDYNPFLKKGTDTGTGQNVGILTKIDPIVNLYRSEEKVSYPIEGTNCYPKDYNGTIASGTSGVSKHYITEFNINGINIAFIARCAQREAQAQVVHNIVLSYIKKGYEIILMGDMNDYDDEILDSNSNKPTSRVLDFLKGSDSNGLNNYELLNIAYRMKQDERYSDWWDSDNNCNTSSKYDYSMIDHILVTSNIDKLISNIFIYHGYDEYCGKWNSDHYPVVVDLKI